MIYTAFSQLYGGFRTTVSRGGELAYSLTIAAVLTDAVFYCILCLLSYRLVNPLVLLALLGVNIALGVVWSWIAIRLTDRLYPPMRTYLIYENEDAYHSVQKVKNWHGKFCVVKEIASIVMRRQYQNC